MTSQPPALDANTAIGYLIGASGNPKLAAVNASRDITHNADGITEAQLLGTIAADPTAVNHLANQVRLLAIMQSLNAMRITHHAYMESIPELSAKDTAKAYTDMLDAIIKLSSGFAPTTPPNADDIIKRLPPEVAEAMRVLLEPPADTSSPDNAEPVAHGAADAAEGVTDSILHVLDDEDEHYEYTSPSVIFDVVGGDTP